MHTQLRAVGIDLGYWLEHAFQRDLEGALDTHRKKLVARLVLAVGADRWQLQMRHLPTGAQRSVKRGDKMLGAELNRRLCVRISGGFAG